MKKVILGAAALMIGTFTFAQSITAPVQAEHIGILPGAAPTANSGQSQQNGNDNRVQVMQAGTNQSASTYQSDGSGTGGNLTWISQIGAVSSASGVANNAEVRQMGTENQSTTDQQGDYNSALTKQGLNDDGSAGNMAWIRQGTNEQAQNNAAEINQDGDDNVAKTKQTFDNNEALINQMGDDNKAFSIQNGGPNGTVGHAAQIDQTGDGNEAYSNQSGNGAQNNALVYQLGDNNESQQVQINSASSGGSQNWASVTQGDGARDGWALNGSIWLGQLTSLDDILTGSFNGDSYGATAYQFQDGTDNQAEVHQFGGGSQNPPGNYAEQHQDGDRNDAFIQQNAYGSAAGGANYARQDQDGNNNQAGVAQLGVGHKLFQTQTGNYNIAMSTQRGECNQVNTHQIGDQNVVNTAQRGIDNGILVVQDGGHSYSVTQNLPNGSPVGMPNGHNSVNVLQLGPSGTNPGIDCTFDPALDINQNYNVPGLSIADVCPGC
jgi:hypothetical protein